MILNWKDRGNGRYDALASRVVGGKYFIRWQESYYSEEYSQRFESRRYRIDYQTGGGGGIGNVDQSSIRTLKEAKALAEAHHERYVRLIREYGDLRNVPFEAWSQFKREMLALQGFPDAQS